MFLHDVKKILQKRLLLHDENDHDIEKCRNSLMKLLSENEEYTVNFLVNCSKDELLMVSEVFEEIAYNLQSQKYIRCLDTLDKKYPELKLTSSIDIAKRYMD